MNWFRNFKNYHYTKGVRSWRTAEPHTRIIAIAAVVFLVTGLMGILHASIYRTAPPTDPSQQRGVLGIRTGVTSKPYRFLDGANKLGKNSSTHTTKSEQHVPPNTHTVVTTVFWVGEGETADNGYISNVPSAWDEQWAQSFGGVDDPTHRTGFRPAAFIPKENPFYFALPYSDLTDAGVRKTSATNCPNAPDKKPYSWCKNTWIKVTHGNKTAYAQWEDVGPYETDDVAYVFGTAAPKNKFGAKAGLDVSPAVRDYLGLSDVDTTTWQFISEADVPQGPWKQIITTSLGYKI